VSQDFLSSRQIQGWLGISKPTLLSWLRRKDDPLPGVKIGGRWKFRRQAVLEWWERREKSQRGACRESAKRNDEKERAASTAGVEELNSWLVIATRVLAEEVERRQPQEKEEPGQA